MRKIFAFLLTFIMALSTTCVAFAGEMPAPSNTYPVEYEYFDDGSYIVTTITEEPWLYHLQGQQALRQLQKQQLINQVQVQVFGL